MRDELDPLLRQLAPATPANEPARLAFAHACVSRVAHLLEDDEVKACLAALGEVVAGRRSRDELPALAARADALANHHQGSRSLDGVGHAAVSASYAVAKALAGNARQAAEYAAYAAVYGAGGYGATSDPDSFTPEYEWQARQLRRVLEAQPA
jgi:hypothetical protein